MSGGEGVEEGKGPGREGEGEEERRERDKHLPLCSTQQDRRAGWNSEWKVVGFFFVNERGEGERGAKRQRRALPHSPQGEILFLSIP